VYVLMTTVDDPEPRLQRVGWGSIQPFFGLDVYDWNGDDPVRFDATVAGYPYASLADVPPGRYRVQAIMDVYDLYQRSDGHALWLPRVEWEGRVFTKTPGNFFSAPQWVTVAEGVEPDCDLVLDAVVPPIRMPGDSEWVQRFRIRSELLSEFWGRDIELGAVVLLPAGYEEDPHRRYPVVYVQNHFSFDAPFAFPEPRREEERRLLIAQTNEITEEATSYHEQMGFVESPQDFYAAWTGADFPRFIAVTFQHPNPWFDSSHAVDSANTGPYGRAIFEELIPAFEERFRTIRESWARVLTGGSTGGWTSLALQIFHPEFFGGAWVIFPDSVDFRRMVLSDIYSDESVYYAQDHEERERDHRLPSQEWLPAERPFRRTVEGQVLVTFRDMSRLESVVASRCRSGLQLHPWHAIFGPTGDDGYPVPLWDEETGRINRDVAEYWRRYDLADFLRTRWPEIGPELVGKLHFGSGDMDNYYLNTALYLLEDFLEATTDPYYGGSFHYGRPKQGHFYVPWHNEELLRMMANHMASNAPEGADLEWLG
jgi:hypothetical protein